MPDVLNAGISITRGDVAGAGLSALGAVPYFGIVGNTARLGRSAMGGHGLARNPFRGKVAGEIDDLFTSREFKKMGPDPMSGRGSSFHPRSGQKYYLDPGGRYRGGVELPHVDVHRMRNGRNIEELKRKYPLGDVLYE